MRRFINWIADLIDDYLNAFVEKPLETLSKTISWAVSYTHLTLPTILRV